VKKANLIDALDLHVLTKIHNAEIDLGYVLIQNQHVRQTIYVSDTARVEKKIVMLNKMNYLMLLNTVTFIILMLQVIIYTGSEHKLNGCVFDQDQIWCYTNLHCNYSAQPGTGS